MDGAEGAVAAFVMVLILMGVCFHVGGCVSEKAVREQAIEAHVGRWTIDPATGVREFEFGCWPAKRVKP